MYSATQSTRCYCPRCSATDRSSSSSPSSCSSCTWSASSIRALATRCTLQHSCFTLSQLVRLHSLVRNSPLTLGIAGYISASFYKQIGGEKWAWNIMFTACVFSVPFLTMALLVNIIASHYAATTAISFGTIVLVILIWAGRAPSYAFIPYCSDRSLE